MKLKLYQRVALSQDLPDHQLKQGDVAILIDYIPHPERGEDGYILEVFNALDESIAVVAVSESAVEPVRADEVLAIRPLVETA